MSQTQKQLELQDAADGSVRRITLVGTAHISKESIDEVTALIQETSPACVAIELDEQRLESIRNPDAWRKMDIIKVLREKKGFLLLANLVLAGFQRRMGKNVGVQPGDEMKAAYMCAQERGIPTAMVDRPIQTTLRRAWSCNGLWGKCKLLATLLSSAFDKEAVSGEQIENLKNKSEMDGMMAEIADYLPVVKSVLIDERDRYLASHIWQAAKAHDGTTDAPATTLAVLGAGHLPGVERHLAQLAAGTENADTSDIETVPASGIGARLVGWLIPVLIVALIAFGFYYGGRNVGAKMALDWVLWNGMLAAVGAVLAAAHPVVMLAAFVGAPITSLCPLVGVGMLTGILQAVLCKPKVADMETLQDDVASVRGFYKNRILRVLLVFLLSSLGSSAGTFIAGASFVGKISAFVRGLFSAGQ